MHTLIIVLDTNEFIFGLTNSLSHSAILLENLEKLRVKLPRFILQELHNNLPESVLRLVYFLLKEKGVEIVDMQVPSTLVEKYQSQLPPEDAVIAAYCEFLSVDVLVSENRHFLVDFQPKVFRVLSAQEFLDKREGF